jgi:beta-lactamase regulating signal transducer with metallopeptidase domain
MMTGSMTLLWLAKGTVVLLLAMALTLGLRRAPAGARYVVWLASLAAVLLVPALSTWISVPLPILPATVAANAREPAATGQLVSPAASATERASGVIADAASPAAAASRNASRPSIPRAALDATAALLAVWVGVALLLFAWLVLGALKVRSIVRNGRELTDESWLMPMYDVADRLDLANAPRLVVSDDVEMPFACGVLRPTIVLPTVAESWSDERRRVVLFHELAHVRRRDLLGHTVGRVTCALYWFHPLVWSAAKRLRAESERACDDLVLACGGARASDYATHLLDIVTGVRRQGAPATALPMADKKEFEGRMLAILDPSAKRVASSRLQQILVTAGFGALALSTAAVAPTAQRNIVAGPSSLPVAQVPAGDSAPSRNFAAAVRPRTQPSAGSQTRAGVAALEAALNDEDEDVRQRALWALGQQRIETAPKRVVELLQDSDEDVRVMAAWVLGEIRDKSTMTAVRDAFAKERSHEVQEAEFRTLLLLGDRSQALVERAMASDDPDIRARAVRLIAGHDTGAWPWPWPWPEPRPEP